MISLEDIRWSALTGGYKTPLDPRPLLKRLQADSDTPSKHVNLLGCGGG